MIVKNLKTFRKNLHKHPELANNENNTAKKIKDYLQEIHPDILYDSFYNNSILAIYETKNPGPHVMFRAELDGLPITEKNTVSYKSRNKTISHACGHDGHMSILLGLAEKISQSKKNLNGKISFLFQPAEEIADGANHIISNKQFQSLKPDFIYGFHNLPGYPLNSIILKENTFASASQGMIIKLNGASSHASHPEQGRNPTRTMVDLITILPTIPNQLAEKNAGSLITIIYAKLGEIAFGTSPGDAIIMATLRSYDNTFIAQMKHKAKEQVERITTQYQLDFSIKWVESFPALINNKSCVELLRQTAKNLQKQIIEPSIPFSWSEDFSFYLKEIPGAYFGIGSGENHAPLHSCYYDFPDEILMPSIDFLFHLIKQHNQLLKGVHL
jgi:amidohydrolase